MSQHVAIAGATGAVGTEFLKLLEVLTFTIKIGIFFENKVV